MKKIRILQVSFDAYLPPYQLPAFRAAMAEKIGFQDAQKDTGKSLLNYPLIQCKLESFQADRTRPMLVCLEHGIEEAYTFFAQPDWTLTILGEPLPLKIAKLDVKQQVLNIWEQFFRFRLHKWQALSLSNSAAWQAISDDKTVQTRFLEKCLVQYIQDFATGVNWTMDRDLTVKITQISKYEWIEFKKVRTLVFTIDFETNASLPDFIGLGKGLGVGYGVLRSQTTRNN